MSCESLFACSNTGSIRIASFVVKSASKYVYVLLTESNNCLHVVCVRDGGQNGKKEKKNRN